MMTVLNSKLNLLPLSRVCQALCLNRSTVYAHRRKAINDEEPKRSRLHSKQPSALIDEEKVIILEVLNSEFFVDQPPREVYQRLLENGQYLCSVSTQG